MATTPRMSLTEKARVWSSLDENLREKVRNGQLSLQEAAGFVVPIGDLEMGSLAPKPVASPSSEGYGLGTMAEINKENFRSFRDTVGASFDSANLDLTERVERYRGQGMGDIFNQEMQRSAPERNLAIATAMGNPIGVAAAYLDDATAAGLMALTSKVQEFKGVSTEDNQRQQLHSLNSLVENKRQLEETAARLRQLPQNPYTASFVSAVDNGDWWEAAKNAPGAVGTTMGEQAATLAAQAALVMGTYALTKNKRLTAATGMAAGGLGGFSELGSDMSSMWEAIPEEERTLEKFREVLGTAQTAASARTLIEGALPGVASKLGKTAVQRLALETAGQVTSGMAGEAVASEIKGQDASFGELLLEGLADTAGVVTEAGPGLREAQRRDADDARTEANYQAAVNRDFERSLRELQDQRLGEANRAKFDVEQQAEEALRVAREAEALNNAEQAEMPFGSGYGGNLSPTNADGTPTLDADGNPATATGRRVYENDRVPTMVDMFSGESTAAPRIVARQQQAEADTAAGRMPEETDEAFEIRSQRTSDARNQIDARKQADFENQKNEQRRYRQQLAEAQVTTRNQRQLLSTADVTREAKRLLDIEKEGVRKQRAGIARTPERMDALLKSYERQRLPELVDIVRTRRIAQVNAAQDLLLAEKERQKNLDDIRVEGELGRRQDERAEAARPAPELATDLFADQPGQRELTFNEPQPASRGAYTGTLTDEQARTELAAGQLERQRQTERDRPAAAAREAEAVKTEQAAAAKSVAEAVRGRETLTQKNYTNKERKHREALTKKELDNRGTRTPEQVADAVAAGMVEWRKSNPPPKAPETAQGAVTTAALEERARTIQNRREATTRSQETKRTNRELDRELRKGATPAEAAERVANRQMTAEEDAALRAQLGASRRGPKDLPGNPFLGESHPKESIRRSNVRSELANPALYDAIKAELAKDNPSIVKVLDLIARDPNTSEFQKRLAFRLRPIMEQLGVSLSPSLEGMDAGGTFRPTNNTIYVNSITPTLVLHEALHAALSGAVSQPWKFGARGVKLVADLEKLRLDTIEGLNQPLINREGDRTNPELGNRLAKDNGPLSSVDELVSYFMTEPSLQFLINQLPASSTFKQRVMNFAGKFYKAVLDFLGLNTPKNATALTELTQSVDELLSMVEADMPTAQALQTSRAGQLNSILDPDDDFTDPTSERSFVGPGKIMRPEWKTATGQAIADTLTAGGGKTDFKKGTKSRISEIFERSTAETGAYILRAEQLFKQMDSGLSKQATKLGRDQDAYRKEFARDVEAFENADGRVTKAAEARKLNKKYNKVARSYFRARRTIDSLSNEILQQRLADPTPFTEGEAAIYTSIKENIGRYYTRVYAANTKGIGKARAEKLWKEYTDFSKGTGNAEFKDGYETVRNAIDYVSNHDLVVPDEVVLEDMPMADLQELAKAWGIKIGTGASLDSPMTTEVRRETLIAELDRFRDVTPGVKQQRARVLVEDLLFARNHAALSKYYRGEQADRTIVEDRKFVPEEIRELLGEYQDLPLKAMTTIIRMSAFRSKTKAFQEFLEAESGNTVLTDEEFTERGLSPQDWKKLTEASYGPLQNMWVRKDVADKLAGSVEVTRTFDQMMAMGEAGAKARVMAGINFATDKWMGFAGLIKQAQLVWNTSNAVLNYSGGPIAMASNGNTSLESVRRAHKIATSLVAAQASGHLTKDMEKVVRAGITDSAMLGAIRKVEAEKLDEILFANLRSPVERKKERVYQKGAAATRTWRETYAMADVVWKIANFLEEEAKLTAFYKAEGIDMAPEAIEREAAWHTNLSNFSYKRVPNLLKDVEKAGLTYVMPYIYETFRAPVGSFMVAINDFQKASQATTREGRNLMLKSGIKRGLGSVLTLGMLQQAAFVAAKYLDDALGEGDEEEEKWVERLKVFLPEYKKYADFFYMGRNSRGEPVLFEFSRLDPFGPASEFYRMVAGGAEPEEYLTAMKNLVIGNPYGKGILQAFFGQSGTNTRIEDITPGQYDKLVQLIGTRGAKAVDTLMPSAILRPFDPNNEEATNDPVGAIFTAMGGQVYNIQPEKSVGFMVQRFDVANDDISEDFRTILKTRTELTDNALLSELVSLRDREAEAFESLTDSYQGMLELGYTPEQALGQMKAAGLKDADLPIVALGYRPEYSGVVNLGSLEQSFRQMPDTKPERKEKYLNNIRRLLALIESGQVPARRK